MNKEYLPIGTVVQLKNSTARVMIAGYFPMPDSRPGEVHDYSGFKFPIGYVSDDEVYCFDHDQIELICAYGYQDQEQMQFMEYVRENESRIREGAAGRENG